MDGGRRGNGVAELAGQADGEDLDVRSGDSHVLAETVAVADHGVDFADVRRHAGNLLAAHGLAVETGGAGRLAQLIRSHKDPGAVVVDHRDQTGATVVVAVATFALRHRMLPRCVKELVSAHPLRNETKIDPHGSTRDISTQI